MRGTPSASLGGDGRAEKPPLNPFRRRRTTRFFPRLEPGAHIPPHSGILNCRLICHLPLIVPPGCWLRVGNETREWEEGKLMIFDDSMEHEAKEPQRSFASSSCSTPGVPS